MSTKEQYWKYSLIIIIIGLGIILFRQITPFLSGLLGALTIYILVRRQMIYLSEKRKMKRSIAATIITAEAILCFLIPLALVVWLAIINLQNINLDPQAIIAPFEQTAAIIKAKTGYNILGGDSLSFVLSSLPRIGQTLMGGISSFAVNMFVLVFVLYFMLIGGKKMEQYVNGILPFNETNTQNVVHEINMIVRSNAIDVIVVDSVAALVTKQELEGEIGDSTVGAQARLMSAALRKLTSFISKARTVCIFTNQIREKIGVMFGNPETTPGGRALKFYASVRVDIRRIGQIKGSDGVIAGNRTKIKVVKNKVAPPFTECEFDIMYNEGISSVGSLLDLATEYDIIQKRGSWISYNGSQIAQGRDAAKEALKSNPELYAEIEEQVKAKMDEKTAK